MSLWTPGHSKDCILPLSSAIGVTSKRVCYLNKEQRNVHIWNSLATEFSPQTGSPVKFQLLASESQSHLYLCTNSFQVFGLNHPIERSQPMSCTVGSCRCV